jgi:hypothetical protein
MAQPEQTAAAASAPEQRTCVKCSTAKIVSPETWPYRKAKQGRYSAYGGVCLVCEKKRRAEYEKRRDKIAALVADVPTLPANGDKDVKDAQKTALASSKLDVAKALKAGSKVLNEYAPAVLARVLQQFEDTEDPNHQWALQFLAERILPRKLYEELGGAAAGSNSIADKRPVFVVQVLPAQPGAEPGRVVEGQVTNVEVLPTPE